MKHTRNTGNSSASADFAQNLYLNIVKDDRIWRAERDTSLQLITEYLAGALDVSRVSIWILDNDTSLKCLDLFDADRGEHRSGREFNKLDYPKYFSVLDEGRIIDAHDAYTDPRTLEFAKSYLNPFHIGAMLNATLRTAGQSRGVISLENTTGPRLWTKKEKAGLLCVADLLTQLLMHHDLKYTVDRYESLLSNMQLAAFRCQFDATWTMEYISAGIQDISGYLPKEFFAPGAISFQSLIHPEDKPRVMQVVAQSIRGSQCFDLEYRIVHRTGEIRWIHQYGRTLVSSRGKIEALDGVLVNITQSKSVEALQGQKNELFLKISESLSGATGEAFFRHLTQELAKVLAVDFVFIARIRNQDNSIMETLAVYGEGKHQANFSYDLANSPCANVVDRGICAFSQGVQKHFPKDILLQKMGIEGYLGTPLTSSGGCVLGVMVALNSQAIKQVEMATALLKIFSVRASAELERQLAEQELITSKSYYQSLFHAAGDSIFMVQDGIIVDCNSTSLATFGAKRQELIGLSPIDISPEKQPDGSLSKGKALQKIEAAAGGTIQHFDWVHTNLKGEAFETEVTLSRINVDGKFQMLGIVRDVSERRRRDNIIKKQGEQLRASIESLPGIFYMFNQEGKVVHFNKAYLDHVGVSAEEALSLEAVQYVHPDDKERVGQALRRVMDEGKTEQIELRSIANRGQGPVVHLLATGKRTFLDGKPYIVGAAFDIGERVRAEENLEKSQQALKDHNQNLLILNTLSNRLFGLRREDEILDQALLSLSELPFSPLVVYWVVDTQRDQLCALKGANVNQRFDLQEIKIPLQGSLAGLALRERSPQISENIESDVRQSPELINIKRQLLGVVSEVSLPLFDRDKPLGVISVMYRQSRSFLEAETQALTSMVNNIAISITSARYTHRLQYQAQHDSLTGLYNRAALHSRLEEELTTKTEKLALMLVDLDRFKEVNDTLGHDIGDQLICTIGPRLQQVLQGWSVFLSRLGGDEFALLVQPSADEQALSELADLILEAIREPMAIEGVTLEISASIGIVICELSKIRREEILRRADVAMYHAKSTNVGYFLYRPEIDNHSREKLTLMAELRTAIDLDQFVMHYQPKIDLKTGKIVGFESLIRWQHPERGLIYPDEFIHLVEISDLIHPLTQLALRKSLVQLSEWNRAYNMKFTMAVNISTRNLLDNDFTKKLEELFRQLHCDAAHLELEITESTLISDPRRSLENLRTISKLGVQFSIDDFGTGYSSLAYLKQLPIETLKIDRSFVMDMDKNKHDEAIVSSTIALAHSLGMRVVAEGVERQNIQDMLSALGCDFAQGYHISKPVGASAATDLIQRAFH